MNSPNSSEDSKMWSTAVSWATLLAITAIAVRYYCPELFKRWTLQSHSRVELPDDPQTAAARRARAKRTHASRLDATNSGASTPTSASEAKANKRRKLVSTPVENEPSAPAAQGGQVSSPRDEEGDMSNKEFAQQLAKAQSGTKLEPPKEQPTSKKDRRAAKKAQGNQNGLEASGLSTDTSSTTGRDADDDLSPVGSPSTGPISTAPTSRAGDVSDMLEVQAAKPTTLRLIDIKDTVTKAVPKTVSKAFEPVLSKKQRQRQAKQAEQKALREESDRLHEAKKQAQLRTARMAEGTSNQIKANSFAMKQNAWQAGKQIPVMTDESTSKAEVAPLLDTFERPTVKVNGAVYSEPLSKTTNSMPETANANTIRQDVGVNKTGAAASSSREKIARPVLETRPSWADEVNEEEQDKWANELAQEEKWEPVTTKKAKKKAKKDNDTSSEASSSLARQTSATTKAVMNGANENGVKPRSENLNRFQSIEQLANSSLKDAEWEA